MKIKIFNCHHATPESRIRTGIFSTLVSGQKSTDEVMGDLDGDNISSENSHSEMRHQYYVWKNLLHEYDYVGFEHYRRVLFLDAWSGPKLEAYSPELLEVRRKFAADPSLPYAYAGPSMFDAYWRMRQDFDFYDENRLKSFIGRHDVLVPRAVYHGNMRKQWFECDPHFAKDAVLGWDVMLDAIRRSRIGRGLSYVDQIDIFYPSFNNIYIMNSELFDDYMKFYFDAVEMMKEKIPTSPRLWGHFSERMLNVYLCIKRIQAPNFVTGRLPYLHKVDEYAPPV